MGRISAIQQMVIQKKRGSHTDSLRRPNGNMPQERMGEEPVSSEYLQRKSVNTQTYTMKRQKRSLSSAWIRSHARTASNTRHRSGRTFPITLDSTICWVMSGSGPRIVTLSCGEIPLPTRQHEWMVTVRKERFEVARGLAILHATYNAKIAINTWVDARLIWDFALRFHSTIDK